MCIPLSAVCSDAVTRNECDGEKVFGAYVCGQAREGDEGRVKANGTLKD